MARRNLHLSDERLLLYTDGELPLWQSLKIRTHLAACWECRARMAQLEATIADFVRAHHATSDHLLQPIDGPRALLRARLTQLKENSRPGLVDRMRMTLAAHRYVYAIAAGVLLLLGALSFLQRLSMIGAGAAETAAALPNPAFTPGATQTVALSDICSLPHDQVVRRVSPSVREAVFREYGLASASAGDYEIDHLVTPGLGGSDDMRNLWPEPHSRVEWNSYVKDQLEDHLHHLVCSGQITLSTAQKDMEGNWISAYQRYFNTDRPLLPYSSATAAIMPGSFAIFPAK